LLEQDLKVALQMRWAVRLATARKLDLLILQGVKSSQERVEEIQLDEPAEGKASGAVREVMGIIEEAPELLAGPRQSADVDEKEEGAEFHVVHVRFKRIHYTSLSSLRRLVLAELMGSKVKLFTLAREQLLDMSDVDLVRESRFFLRYMPCEVVLCQGLKEGTAFSRILIAAARGPNGKAALQLGLDLSAPENVTPTALHVNPDVGMLAEQVGELRLDRLIRKALGANHPPMNRRVVVDDQTHSSVRRVWEEGNHDLIVVGASASHIETSLGKKLGRDVPLIIVSAASPFTNRFKKIVEETLQRVVPQIDREDRIALVDRLQSSAAWNFDFLALMVLSTIMAAMGLIQNSAAVVIGAMLVAPLMTPLLGLGLALVQGNPMLARLSLRSVGLGLCVALFCGLLVGLGTMSFEEPTREMLSRGGPGLLDLFVAFAAGLAAAYASCRPGLIAALPGVAIAAALVPPIATSGLALALGDFALAVGALLLFVINMVTIVLACVISLLAVGIRNIKKTSRWTVIAGGAVIVSVLTLGVYLSLQPWQHELTEELPEGLMAAVQENLGADYKLDSLALAYDELGVQLNVSVVGKTPAPEELATSVRTAASDHYDQPVRVRLLTRIAIDVDPVK
jgi:uncharacterized hydrophobic protein (TIGR00271 family)